MTASSRAVVRRAAPGVVPRRRRWSALLSQVQGLRFDAALLELMERVSEVDGFPTASGVSGRRRAPQDPNDDSSGPLTGTVVERMALGAALRPDRDRELVDRCLASIEREVGRLSAVLGRYEPALPSDDAKVLCTAANYTEPWAPDVPCDHTIEYTPAGTPRQEYLCCSHRQRRARWQREQEAAAEQHDQVSRSRWDR